MIEDTLWFIDKKKENCGICGAEESVRIEYYNAVRLPLDSNSEFITRNNVRKKTKKVCEKCSHTEESWEEWVETRYPKGYESDFLRRRALYFMEHVPSMAGEGLDDLLKIRPYDLEMLYEYAKFLIRKKDLVEAYPILQRAAEKKKDFLPAVETLNDLLYSLFIAQNEFWYEKRLYYGRFVKLFSSFIELRNRLNENLRYLLDYHKNNPAILSKYCLQTGNLLEDKRNFSMALQYYEYVLNCSQELWQKSESCIRMAVVYSNLQDYKNAYIYLDKSYSISPNVLVHLHRSRIYSKQGETEKASSELSYYLKQMDKLIESDPENPRLFYYKGLGLSQIETPEKMAEFYSSVTEELTIDLDFRKIFYERINYYQSPPKESVTENPDISCPVCNFHKLRHSENGNQIAG
ncbi:MAG TPA: hypothetical protein PL163_14110, partial [Leptospiraceae bacterium]|nr:hypothetical protein [Leptospiraceae bacterium]